jgi:hypothetical protein
MTGQAISVAMRTVVAGDRCLTAAAATFITLPLTWREARAALSRQVG